MSFNLEVGRDSINYIDKAEMYQVDINRFYTLEEVANYLINIGYLPLPTRDEEFWCMGRVWVRYPWRDRPERKQELFNELGRIDKNKRTFFEGKITEYFLDPSMKIYFRFFPDNISRAEYLFKLYNGSKQGMYTDGYDKEYLSYHVSKELEKDWEHQMRNIQIE